VLATAALALTAAAKPPERLPDFPGGVRWINSEPLTVEDLRGKVVLLDVWTFG
jgi:hypothetical protein